MKKQNLVLVAIISFLAITVVFTGCKKTEDPPAITGEALFSYVSVGKTVTFTNESTITGTVTYAWQFGDGATSTETNPVHTYDLKGEYTVTLTATDQNAKTYPISTKVKVDKETRISLTDNSFDDWNAVTGDKYVVNVGDNAGAMVAAKFDYDAKFIYVYFSFEGNLTDVFQNDVVFDVDNDSLTGQKLWLWPASGGDFLMEIAPFVGGDQTVAPFEYTGEPGVDDWNWTDKELAANAFIMGTIKQEGANITAEFAFDREKVPGLTNDVVGIGGFISDADWGEYAFAPDATAEGGAHTSMFVLDMR